MANEPNEHEEDFLNEHEDDAEEAKGGPVDQPAGAKPMGPPTKGKISAQTAKRIWFLCIGVSVLAIAAVVVDYVFDLRGVRGPTEDPNANVAPVTPRTKKGAELTEHQKLAREFAYDTFTQKQKMERSRVYDAFQVAANEVEAAAEAATEDHGNGEKWAEAWKKYYRARYLLELFRWRWPINRAKLPLVGDLQDNKSMEDMEEDELKDPEVRSSLASKLVDDRMYSQISGYENKWKQFAKAGSVFSDNEEVKAARQTYEAARSTDNPVFAEEDKEMAQQPPRADGEPAPYETE